MNTIKLGNEVKCMISIVDAREINGNQFQQQYQPYTMIEGDMALTFKEQNKTSTSFANIGSYTTFTPDIIYFYDVLLTDKILNLIYKKTEDNLIMKTDIVTSDEEGNIFLNESSDIKCVDIFIFKDEKLYKYLENLDNVEIPNVIKVDDVDTQFFITYRISAPAYDLDALNNIYCALDITSISNTEDSTTTTYIHIHKCRLRVTPNIRFNNKSNTIDLQFIVLKNENNFISTEINIKELNYDE